MDTGVAFSKISFDTKMGKQIEDKGGKSEPRHPGGVHGSIDMNSIDLDRQGAGVDIQFDPTPIQDIIDAGIDGFAPVIINITPLPSVLPLLCLEPAIKEEQLKVSSMN